MGAGSDDVIRVAAIDIGSNSVHMVVAQTDTDGSLTAMWRAKEMVGLGRSSFPARRLSGPVMDRAMDSLRRFHQYAQRRQCAKVVAVATSAVREAENGGDFIERVRSELGINVRVVSAREEARLIHLGVAQTVDLSSGPHLIVDIGGGSVEFIVADHRRVHLLESRKIGAARMTAQFIDSDPVSGDDLKALLAHYDRELGPLVEQIAALKPVRALGCSGTLENLAAMCGTDARQNGDGLAGSLPRGKFMRLLDDLLESRAKDRAGMRGLDSQRQDQIVAGAVLVGELFRRLDLDDIHLSRSALREGILVDWLQRHLPELVRQKQVPDPRRRSVLDLARRCDWHQVHAEHVARLTMMLFDQLKPLHRLGSKSRQLIEYGALLHDIGWHIARKKHHRHSQYLIAHGDLRGFTRDEVRVIGCIARYHRGKRPKLRHEDFGKLSTSQQRIVRAGVAILRIADGLDRSHCRAVSRLRCRIRRRRVDVLLDGRGEVELDIWGARRKMGYAADLFGRTFSFDQAGR